MIDALKDCDKAAHEEIHRDQKKIAFDTLYCSIYTNSMEQIFTRATLFKKYNISLYVWDCEHMRLYKSEQEEVKEMDRQRKKKWAIERVCV